MSNSSHSNNIPGTTSRSQSNRVQGILSKTSEKQTNNTAIEMDEKRKRRLERNRESARECRKRKKDKMMMLKQNISRLEADNLQLRLKLQIGPESIKQQNDEANEYFDKLATMISEGASENEIRKSLSDLQEKYADYGRDRRSSLDFHITQLRRSLQPTQTTMTILWLMSNAPNYYNLDGTFRQGVNDEVADVWRDLHETLNPTQEQCRQLVHLAYQPLPSPYLSIPEQISPPPLHSSSVDLDDSDRMLNRLEELLSDKNESLDHEMSEIQHILSASQIAKFLLWINKNPAVMQMLEALWPHVTAEAER